MRSLILTSSTALLAIAASGCSPAETTASTPLEPVAGSGGGANLPQGQGGAPPAAGAPGAPPPMAPPAGEGGAPAAPPGAGSGTPPIAAAGGPSEVTPPPPAMPAVPPSGGSGGMPVEPPPADTSTEDTGATSDTTPAGGAMGCTGSELLCEDFEAVSEGAVPTGPWQPLDSSCEFQTASFQMGVSSDRAHGGSKSLKITNKHFAQCRLSGSFGQHDEVWVRAYLYWEPSLDLSDRETLAIDMTPGHRTADDPAVRFGYRSKAPCEEYAGPQVTVIGLGGGEVTGCGSRELPRGQWYCFEAHLQQSGLLEVRTYIDSEAISYQSTGKPQTESIVTQQPVTEKIDHIRLGLFSTGEAQGIVYVDDIAVATSRVGCAP